jgi:hypothetical protein
MCFERARRLAKSTSMQLGSPLGQRYSPAAFGADVQHSVACQGGASVGVACGVGSARREEEEAAGGVGSGFGRTSGSWIFRRFAEVQAASKSRILPSPTSSVLSESRQSVQPSSEAKPGSPTRSRSFAIAWSSGGACGVSAPVASSRGVCAERDGCLRGARSFTSLVPRSAARSGAEPTPSRASRRRRDRIHRSRRIVSMSRTLFMPSSRRTKSSVTPPRIVWYFDSLPYPFLPRSLRATRMYDFSIL